MTQHEQPAVRSRRGEAGSAYMIVIGSLAVLSTIGLALIAVTQTEFQIGASERVTNRVFYAADSGIAVATARALVSGDYTATTFGIQDSPTGSAITSTNQVTLTPFYPINDQPCNFCEINDTGEYSNQSYRKINHAVTVTASRFGVPVSSPGDTPVQSAQKQLASMVEVQPWRSSSDAYAAASDPAQLANIRF